MIVEEGKKTCRCKATASGPRIIIKELESNGITVKFKATCVRMACDECDKEWKYSVKEGSPDV